MSGVRKSPFQPIGLEKKMVVKRHKGVVVDKDTGEVIDGTPLGSQVVIEVDKASFVKLYIQGVKILRILSRPSLEVFCYIAENLRIGSQEVELSRQLLLTQCPSLKGSGYYKAIQQLTALGVISLKEGTRFYVNPNILHNGKRKSTG